MDVYKSKAYRKLQGSYMELAEEKALIEEELKNSRLGNRILRAALHELHAAQMFTRFV
jgi:hypothetical protein